jgi:hypothetical protein
VNTGNNSNLDSRSPSARLAELVAAEVTGSLDPAETLELAELRRRLPLLADPSGNPIDDGSHALAAGALLAASVHAEASRPENRLSDTLRQRLLTQGQAIARQNAQDSTIRPSQQDPAALTGTGPATAEQPGNTQRPLIGPLGWVGWLAAAVAIGVAITGVGRPAAPAKANPLDRLAALAADPENTVRIAWQAQADPAAKGLSGEVIWNGQFQEGFMRFKGLAANEPTREQYQLWIFDAGRTDSEFPVDGGVFDLAAGFRDEKTGDLYVPINAKLPVRKPAAFAVTIEQPGGVVVTKKERLLVLAPVAQPGS